MNYEVGLVNLNPNIKDIQTLENACRSLGYNPFILDLTQLTKEKVFAYIKKSKIKKWIFSGSRSMVTDSWTPKIPLDIFNLENKEFMMICYSLQSVIYQLDYPISYRRINKKEIFNLSVNRTMIEYLNKEYLFENIAMPMSVWRNHYAFLSTFHVNIKKDECNLIDFANYYGECMILFYKNAILLQYHPEKQTMVYN
jgi:GMP synthase-like glutamine amidotransferase